jgi:hypothetical protein
MSLSVTYNASQPNGVLFGIPPRVGSSIVCKHKNRVDVIDIDKRSSLLRRRTNYGRKKIYGADPLGAFGGFPRDSCQLLVTRLAVWSAALSKQLSLPPFSLVNPIIFFTLVTFFPPFSPSWY